MSYVQFTAFGSVREISTATVDIPDDRRTGFAEMATYFSAHTNRHVLPITMDSEDDAKLLVKQINQYADEHNLATSPKRDGKTVTFRFAKKRPPKANGPVTVTHTETSAETGTKPA